MKNIVKKMLTLSSVLGVIVLLSGCTGCGKKAPKPQPKPQPCSIRHMKILMSAMFMQKCTRTAVAVANPEWDISSSMKQMQA